MKYLLIAILAVSLQAINTKQILQCQIKARDVGNAVDEIGLLLIDGKKIRNKATEAILKIDRYLMQCSAVANDTKRRTGHDSKRDMIEWRNHINKAIQREKNE